MVYQIRLMKKDSGKIHIQKKEETVEAYVGLDGIPRFGFLSKLLCMGTVTNMPRKEYEKYKDKLQNHS